jgi:RNA polymerase sigma-70 factor (ECF subfamily)
VAIFVSFSRRCAYLLDRNLKASENHQVKETTRVTCIPQNTLIERFEQWYQEEMPRLYRYLCYQVHDPTAAEEITAVTCEQALKKIEQYDPQRGELRVWMFGIARNEVRKYFRLRKGKPELVSFDSLPEFCFQTQSPEQELQQKEAFLHILRTLTTMSDREQEVIALRFGAALPVQQVARIMGIRENHANVLLHRTIQKLRQSQEEVEL